MKNSAVFAFIVAITTLSCASGDQKKAPRDNNPDALYFDYRVSGDGESEWITIRLQFRPRDPEDTSVLLTGPSSVTLDGEPVTLSRTRWDGPYYEISRPRDGFDGAHVIVYIDHDQQQHEQHFQFQAMYFAEKLPVKISRGDWSFGLGGVRPGEPVQLLVSDTASYSRGIERTDTVTNGRISIRAAEWDALANGPIRLEVYRDISTLIRESGKERGVLLLSYRIGTELELQD